ncbi:hypothetical protein [Polycladomyces subterraneus]|uniref:Elongation factor G-binding protein N-terminal domain-containing protein n=1 Tax=Polycladomyces subterraneus TaxID=1016997 RepID=A0ABT8IN74_9BACL|nr:hypothetical protein [Polycladomyces subterraneus]MDN4593822.1 hypothetical protein [Polycladomyces subterraneus]
MEPFLQNHQYNCIAQQAHVLLSALQTSTDSNVVEAVRYSAVSKAFEARNVPFARLLQSCRPTFLAI